MEKPIEAKHLENIVDTGNNDVDGLHGKGTFEDVGALRTVDRGVDEQDTITELPEDEQKRILRKVDWRVVPLLTFLYLVAFVDRSNSGSKILSSPALSKINIIYITKYNANAIPSW